jgi:hypothetical protein
MNYLTYILTAAKDSKYHDIVGKLNRRVYDYQGRSVITSWGRRNWSEAHQLAIL